MVQSNTTSQLNLLEASISELQRALSSGALTSVDLVARYLRRLSVYDANGPKLSAIPILNPLALEEAAASDAYRASGNTPRPLEGIPYLVKDNIKVKGMTVASGSPAFAQLVANEDATCVRLLREAGAVLLGRTNMPAVACGGMQRGIWGRAESPYNADFLAAAYASGSSNGSAVGVTSNFCAFSLGTETISSGRSPASNNALVAYTPSKGLLSLGGVFPLYPTCDVLVPYTRTVADLFQVLDVLATSERSSRVDYYREQPIFPLPSVDSIRPKTFSTLQDYSSLQGKRIGVPSMYIGGDDSSIIPESRVHPRESVVRLWQAARQALEACGAQVIDTDFPLVTMYERNLGSGQLVTVANLPKDWPKKERCDLIAHAWDDFLVVNGQTDFESLTRVDPNAIFPLAPNSLPGEADPDYTPRWNEIVEYPHNKPSSIYDIPGTKQALLALEEARKDTFDKWMDELGLDAIVFPANADVGAANADVDEKASHYAWSNGVLFSNGNKPLRHLGVPTISVPMGIMEDTKMPVNLTFAGKAYDDVNLMRYGFAYEMATKNRVQPPIVPALDSDHIPLTKVAPANAELGLVVNAQRKEILDSKVFVHVDGSLRSGNATISAYVNGQPYEVVVDGETWTIETSYPLSERDEEWMQWTSPALKQTIVIVIASTSGSRTAGKLILL